MKNENNNVLIGLPTEVEVGKIRYSVGVIFIGFSIMYFIGWVSELESKLIGLFFWVLVMPAFTLLSIGNFSVLLLEDKIAKKSNDLIASLAASYNHPIVEYRRLLNRGLFTTKWQWICTTLSGEHFSLLISVDRLGNVSLTDSKKFSSDQYERWVERNVELKNELELQKL